MQRRLVFGGVLVLVALAIAWLESRTIRVRPGRVRFTVAAPLASEPVFAVARIKDTPRLDGADLVEEGEYELTVLFVDVPRTTTPTEVRLPVRVQGQRTLEVQDVTVRLWPWSHPVERLRASWTRYQDDRGRRDVTVRVVWVDGGVASGAWVSCDGTLAEVDETGIADCGRRRGPVEVLAWAAFPDWDESSDLPEPPVAPSVSVVLPPNEGELDLVLDAPADAGE